jgi:catechol 2,3-dioxygenase-like lactoylglutathione lyase family enzyme
MAVELNHIIVPAKDKQASADFLAGILGVAEVNSWGPFVQLHLSNGVALDYYEMDTDFSTQHCAFMVSEEEFDASFERIKQAGIAYWADPFKNQPNEINHLYGGRGVYFDDPSGHSMEIITKSYGAEPPYGDV